MKLDLIDVLGWGYLDIEFLQDKIEEFKLEIDDIKDNIEETSNDFTDINNWIYSTFSIASSNFLKEVEEYAENNGIDFNKDNIEIEVFTNHSDSFLNGDKLNHEIDISDFSGDNIYFYLNWLKDNIKR